MKISKLYGLALAATRLVASVAQAETLTLSTPDSDTSEITLAANKFAEIVSKKTDGKLKIKVFPNGTLYGGDPSAGVKQLAGGSLDMLGEQRLDGLLVGAVERLEADELGVAPLHELRVVVQHVGDPAAHPGREVAAGRPDHDDAAAGHVLAPVVADSLDDG